MQRHLVSWRHGGLCVPASCPVSQLWDSGCPVWCSGSSFLCVPLLMQFSTFLWCHIFCLCHLELRAPNKHCWIFSFLVKETWLPTAPWHCPEPSCVGLCSSQSAPCFWGSGRCPLLPPVLSNPWTQYYLLCWPCPLFSQAASPPFLTPCLSSISGVSLLMSFPALWAVPCSV